MKDKKLERSMVLERTEEEEEEPYETNTGRQV